MMQEQQYNLIVIGGSAGSFPIISHMLESLRPHFSIPIIICIHRLKHVRSGFRETLSLISKNPVQEPFHLEEIKNGTVYIAPANYHLLINKHKQYELSTEEALNFTRPSIDVLFTSAAQVYGNSVLGIILSGANKDGALGLASIKLMGGNTIVQDPLDAQVATMPQSAIDISAPHYVLQAQSIIACIQNL
jgi:two-component system, chemotaxis family, protein-glutamate methylesterase/glutaminase